MCKTMLLIWFCVALCASVGCDDGDGDVGYNLNVGYAIDVFANYGDLSQVAQVVSADYDDDDIFEDPPQPFKEKNIRIFENASSSQTAGEGIDTNMSIQFCDGVDDLLNAYFGGFSIEGTDKPWKAFMGDWVADEIMRTFGIEYNTYSDSCCYVLIKLSKTHRAVKMDPLTGSEAVRDYISGAMDNLNVSDVPGIRAFMKSYGTHYIESYVTGNFIYQVFKYKRVGYNLLKSYMRRRNNARQPRSDDLRFYFSSYFLKQIGDIRIASGNKTVEQWAKLNLRDVQYLYSHASLLRLYYNTVLVNRVNELLDNGALLALSLKTLRPIFRDPELGERFSEIVQNDLQLWEVNA